MRGEPAAAEASVTLHQPEAHHVFSWVSCTEEAGRACGGRGQRDVAAA